MEKEGRAVRLKEHCPHSEPWWWEYYAGGCFRSSRIGNLVKMEGIMKKEGHDSERKPQALVFEHNDVFIYKHQETHELYDYI